MKDLFWAAFERRLRKAIPKVKDAQSIACRVKKMKPIWLRKELAKTFRLDVNCARLVAEFAGFVDGCQGCGDKGDLRRYTLCSYKICDQPMLSYYICVANSEEFTGNCCSLCACAWCSRVVCIEHQNVCECKNSRICYNQGCGGCSMCPAVCEKNTTQSP